MLGFDYSAGAIPPKTLQDYGALVALRYLTPGYPDKSLTVAEAQELLAGGMQIALFWESTAERMLRGGAGGMADGRSAAAALEALGAPAGSLTVYYTGDFDVTAAQIPTCLDYLGSARAALGHAGTAGCYGGLRLVSAAADHGFPIIQTVAWSGGKWDARAVARQTGEQRSVGGITVDVEEIMFPERLGAWGGGSDMELSDKGTTPSAILAKWPFLEGQFVAGGTYSVSDCLIWGDAGARAAAEIARQSYDILTGLVSTVAALSAKVDALTAAGAAAAPGAAAQSDAASA